MGCTSMLGGTQSVAGFVLEKRVQLSDEVRQVRGNGVVHLFSFDLVVTLDKDLPHGVYVSPGDLRVRRAELRPNPVGRPADRYEEISKRKMYC